MIVNITNERVNVILLILVMSWGDSLYKNWSSINPEVVMKNMSHILTHAFTRCRWEIGKIYIYTIWYLYVFAFLSIAHTISYIIIIICISFIQSSTEQQRIWCPLPIPTWSTYWGHKWGETYLSQSPKES